MTPRDDLIKATDKGLYCAAGNFYIDPWMPVEHAVITHAHGDHLRAGSSEYYLAATGMGVARHRLPHDASLKPLEYGDSIELGGTRRHPPVAAGFSNIVRQARRYISS